MLRVFRICGKVSSLFSFGGVLSQKSSHFDRSEVQNALFGGGHRAFVGVLRMNDTFEVGSGL